MFDKKIRNDHLEKTIDALKSDDGFLNEFATIAHQIVYESYYRDLENEGTSAFLANAIDKLKGSIDERI